MPPRITPSARVSRWLLSTSRSSHPPRHVQFYATASAIQVHTNDHTIPLPAKIKRKATTQPPSHKSPLFRKSQLLRQYAAIVQSSPLILVFQHNNLNALEWSSIRRELAVALQKVDAELLAAGATAPPPSKAFQISTTKSSSKSKQYIPVPFEPAAPAIKLQIVQTAIFGIALKTVELFTPSEQNKARQEGEETHFLSKAAHASVAAKKSSHGLEPLLSGPIAILSFPTVSPQHLKAALSVLSPSAPAFPAPSRRLNPGYHEPPVQNGLQKLMLLAARVEGRVFDTEATRWIGSIEGGIEGLRAQLVALLQSFGAGVAGALESAGRNLYFTVEGHRLNLEESENGKPGSNEEAKEDVKAE